MLVMAALLFLILFSSPGVSFRQPQQAAGAALDVAVFVAVGAGDGVLVVAAGVVGGVAGAGVVDVGVSVFVAAGAAEDSPVGRTLPGVARIRNSSAAMQVAAYVMVALDMASRSSFPLSSVPARSP